MGSEYVACSKHERENIVIAPTPSFPSRRTTFVSPLSLRHSTTFKIRTVDSGTRSTKTHTRLSYATVLYCVVQNFFASFLFHLAN